MAESVKSKRIKFSPGKQRLFLIKSREILNLSNKGLAKLLEVSTRTLSDWKREKYHISSAAVRKLCGKTKQKFPRNVKVLNPFWYASKGARKGGLALYHKYGVVGGNPEKRKKRWLEWWNREGKFNFRNNLISKPLPFKKPSLSENLAEFVGIMLGDGGMTKNQLKITLHCEDDLEYSKFVVNLLTKVFAVMPSKHQRSDCPVFNMAISRVNVIKFCVEKLGLKIGNKVKQQVDIPDWIKRNKKYKIACLRGLIDTDGSIIIHRYKSGNKFYAYKKICFTSRSIPLLKSVSEILSTCKIKNRRSGLYDVRIEAQKDAREYFNIVSSHNPKHLKKWRNRI